MVVRLLMINTDNMYTGDLLKEILHWLENLKSVNKLPCIKGWKITLKSIVNLFEEINVKYDVKFIHTRR